MFGVKRQNGGQTACQWNAPLAPHFTLRRCAIQEKVSERFRKRCGRINASEIESAETQRIPLASQRGTGYEGQSHLWCSPCV
eukprot:6203620-Pleurochrysis_carterae.AAC.6